MVSQARGMGSLALAPALQDTLEVARGVMREVPGDVPGFEPLVRYNAFAEQGLEAHVLRGDMAGARGEVVRSPAVDDLPPTAGISAGAHESDLEDHSTG